MPNNIFMKQRARLTGGRLNPGFETIKLLSPALVDDRQIYRPPGGLYKTSTYSRVSRRWL